jgi:hypothetical protein
MWNHTALPHFLLSCVCCACTHPGPLPFISIQALNKAAEAAGVAIKGNGAEGSARYVAGMAANLVDVKNFEESEWTAVSPGRRRPVLVHAARGCLPDLQWLSATCCMSEV